MYQVVLNSYLPRGTFLFIFVMVCRPESVGKLQSNDFQSYFQLFSDPEFAKKNCIYLFREYSNNCKSLRSIDELLYLDAHAYQSVPLCLFWMHMHISLYPCVSSGCTCISVCTPVSLLDAGAYQSVPRCLFWMHLHISLYPGVSSGCTCISVCTPVSLLDAHAY